MIVINHMNGVIKALNDLKMIGFRSCAIISVPDYSGGYMDELVFSIDPDEDWHENPEPFNYVEWHGSIADLYREWPVMTSHRELPHEEPVDYVIDLFGEIVKTLEELRVNLEELRVNR